MARQYVRKGQGATKKELAKVEARLPDKANMRMMRMEEALAQASADIEWLKTQVERLQQDQQRMANMIPPTNAVGTYD